MGLHDYFEEIFHPMYLKDVAVKVFPGVMSLARLKTSRTCMNCSCTTIMKASTSTKKRTYVSVLSLLGCKVRSTIRYADLFFFFRPADLKTLKKFYLSITDL